MESIFPTRWSFNDGSRWDVIKKAKFTLIKMRAHISELHLAATAKLRERFVAALFFTVGTTADMKSESSSTLNHESQVEISMENSSDASFSSGSL